MNKKRLFFDMDNVLVDFKSVLDKIDEQTKEEYAGHLDDMPMTARVSPIMTISPVSLV